MTLPPCGPSRSQVCAAPEVGSEQKKMMAIMKVGCGRGVLNLCMGRKEAGPLESTPLGPQSDFSWPTCQRGRLVGCALRHNDEVHATVGFFLALFRRGFAGPSGDARGVHTLLNDVFLGEIGACLSQFRGFGFTSIGKANDHQFGIRVVLQTESDVIAHALASIVKARCAC